MSRLTAGLTGGLTAGLTTRSSAGMTAGLGAGLGADPMAGHPTDRATHHLGARDHPTVTL